MDSKKISPREFLKERRPERFSDSEIIESGSFDRSVFEYQLSIINKKSLELQFETFAKKLCEKIICPNLLEQTGPVAGGDGKVDTQNFPVSEQNKLLWYVGVNDNSHKDRWAFAVSTKEKWKGKCQSDIKKIKETNRDYKKAFFVTNQYIKSNIRSDVEDGLSKEFSIDVRILDASWIIDQIFLHDLKNLAIEELNIQTQWKKNKNTGSGDYEKELNLKEINKKIKEDIDPSNIKQHQLDWLLEAAVLSKELDCSEIDVTGLFQRAIIAAEKFGNDMKIFDARYQFAWSCFFWFENYDSFHDELRKCIDLAKKIEQSSYWGDVITLFFLVVSNVRRSIERPEDNLQEVKEIIIPELYHLSQGIDRPSNATMCDLYLKMLDLSLMENANEADFIFNDMSEIISNGIRFIGFPLDKAYDFICSVEEVFGEAESYESLLDTITGIKSDRYKSASSARLLLKRAEKNLLKEKPYQAINLVGKSLVRLNTQETKSEFYAGLNIMGEALKVVGMYWASRSAFLWSASLAADEYWRQGETFPGQVNSSIRMAQIELLLGRLEHSFTWLKLAYSINEYLQESSIEENAIMGYEAFFTQRVLNTPIADLPALTSIPDVLEKFQMHFGRIVTLYALGYEDMITEEAELKIDGDFIDGLINIRDANLGLKALGFVYSSEKSCHIKSSFLGCVVNIYSPYRSPLVELSETIAASVENLFSVLILESISVYEPEVEISINCDDEDDFEISHEVRTTEDKLEFTIYCSGFNSERITPDEQDTIRGWLKIFLAEMFSFVIRGNDINKIIDRVFIENEGLSRSISFGFSFIGLSNVIGDGALGKILGFYEDFNISEYEVIRSKPWDFDFPRPLPYPNKNGEIIKEKISHKDVSLKGLIKPRLWDMAIWKGNFYCMSGSGSPIMSLMFENFEPANKIFQGFVKNIGKEDNENRIRVTIIKGVNKEHPLDYRVCIGENIDADQSDCIQLINRVHTMNPSTDENLARFLYEFKKFGKFTLSFGDVSKSSLNDISDIEDRGIMITNLNLRNAWDIGVNDIDSLGILSDDDPYIPEHIATPPVLDVLKSRTK